MKVTVRIEGRKYEVEIEDLNKRPILASVDGEIFEILPEMELGPSASSEPASLKATGSNAQPVTDAFLLAPLPGTITEIFVLPGAQVQAGQPVCVIEAMKMKNTIHADRSGTIANVLVGPGQTVIHRQALVEFTK